MRELVTQIPDVEAFLALAPEELAVKMLFLLRQRRQDMFTAGSLENELWGGFGGAPGPSYPSQRQGDVHLAFAEAWAWLEAQGLLVPAEGTNGTNGWRHLSRRARQMESPADFADYRVARLIPREILNARIADPVWRAMMRGEYDVAVMLAMKAVEVAVREASGIGGDGLVGVKLMRAAFAPEGGPLTDPDAEGGERVARIELFAGAIGSFKNPHSHRDVDVSDPLEAIEAIYLANMLLRIVDGCRSRRTRG
jgi:uncharacterized protein (TIGR02391 family)